jgi:hypothetical protein
MWSLSSTLMIVDAGASRRAQGRRAVPYRLAVAEQEQTAEAIKSFLIRVRALRQTRPLASTHQGASIHQVLPQQPGSFPESIGHPPGWLLSDRARLSYSCGKAARSSYF